MSSTPSELPVATDARRARWEFVTLVTMYLCYAAFMLCRNTVVFGECYTCGLPVAMTKSQRRQYDEYGATMWCSQGHQTVRTESELTKTQRQLREAQDRSTRAETQRDDYINLFDVEVTKRRKLEKRINADH